MRPKVTCQSLNEKHLKVLVTFSQRSIQKQKDNIRIHKKKTPRIRKFKTDKINQISWKLGSRVKKVRIMKKAKMKKEMLAKLQELAQQLKVKIKELLLHPKRNLLNIFHVSSYLTKKVATNFVYISMETLKTLDWHLIYCISLGKEWKCMSLR